MTPPPTGAPPSPTKAVLTVHQAIAAVIAALRAIGKDSEMSDGPRYSYRSVEAVKAALKPLLGQYGVFYIPHRIVSVEDDNVAVGSRGAVWHRVLIHVQWRIYAADGSYIAAQSRGEGVDSSDKASNKAFTSAEKQMLLIAFCIADGSDDPDHERPELAQVAEVADPKPVEHQAAGPVAATRADLMARVHELRPELTEAERADVKVWLSQAGIGSVNRARVAELAELVDHIEALITARDSE